MEKLNLRKMTAFSAALVLSTQSGICALNAEESDNTVEAVIRESLSDSYNDKDHDGFLSDEELSAVYSVTLDGSKLKDKTSFDFLKKLSSTCILNIQNWENFDYNIIKNIKEKPFTSIHFISSTMKKTDEKFSDVINVSIKNTENFDLEALSSFTELRSLDVVDSTVKNLSVIEKLNLESLYSHSDGKTDEEFYKFLKFPDIEVPEGYRCRVDIKPHGFLNNRGIISVKDNGIAASNEEVIEDNLAYIHAVSEGKTEYEVKDKEGKLIGSGKVTVTPDKPFDEPLVSEKLPEFRIIEPNGYSTCVYILFEDGRLYSFNKEGKGELTKIDDNVADFYEHSRANNIAQTGVQSPRGSTPSYPKMYAVLYKDGVLKVDGKALNDPKDYTVLSFAERGGYCLCSDGRIRTLRFGISAEDTSRDVYGWSELKGLDDIKIKAVSNYYYFDWFPICQLEDGRTVKLEFEKSSDNINIIDLGLNITPVKFIAKIFYSDDPGAHETTYYITDPDNNLYEVILPDGESEPKTRLAAKNVKDLGYIYGKTQTTYDVNAYVAYLGEDNEYHDPSGERKYEDYNRYTLGYDWIYTYNPSIDFYSASLATTEKGTVINDNRSVELFSKNDINCTEKFSCLGNYASMTHVKDTIGAFFDGKDLCILITREDNTLWKYCIEGNTFTRIDPNLKAVSPKKYTAIDIVSMMRFLCGIDEVSDWMDINCDGVVNVLDFIRMKKEMLKNF